MLGYVGLEQFTALAAIEIDDSDAILSQPIEAAGEGAAAAHHHSPDPELADEAAAIPAWRQGCNHDQVPVAALPAGAAKRVDLGVHPGVALLHPPVVAPAEQFARRPEH